MSLKRLLFMLLSAIVFTVAVMAAFTIPDRAATSVQTTPAWRGAFVQDYEVKHGAIEPDTEDHLVSSANAVCGDLVAGNTVPEVWKMLTDDDHWAESSDQAATVIELAVQYYCPQYRQQLQREGI